jgi:hypothetical protein
MDQLPSKFDEQELDSGAEGALLELQRHREVSLQRRREESAEMVRDIMALAQRFFPTSHHPQPAAPSTGSPSA